MKIDTTKTKEKKPISVAIIDDNEYYSKLVKKWLQSAFDSPIYESAYTFSIKSFTDPDQIDLINDKYDIAFVDYYLSDHYTAIDLIPKIMKYQPQCKIYITSQSFTDLTAFYTIDKGATGFIYKGDKDLLQKQCSLIRDLLTEKMAPDEK